jgi:hypothetical protein
MWKELKLSLEGGDSGSKKYKRGYGSAWSVESGGRCFVSTFGRNMVLVAVNKLSHLFYHFFLYKFCTFKAICKYNATIDCITVRHKFHLRQLWLGI